MYTKPVIHNGKNYQPQLVIAGVLLSPVSHLSFTLFTSLRCCDEGNQSDTCFWQNEKEKSHRYPLHDEVMKPDDSCPIKSEILQHALHGPFGERCFFEWGWMNQLLSNYTIHLIQTSAPLNSHTSMFHVLWLEDGWLSGCVHLIRNIAYQ